MDALMFCQVIPMILSDRPVQPVDAIVLHGRSFNGDDDGLFELIAELIRRGVSKDAVLINGGNGRGLKEETRAWPGMENYAQRLHLFECKVFISDPARSTLEEGIVFQKAIQDYSWKRVIVVAQPFQLLRIMLTHLKQMQKQDRFFQLYAAAPLSVDWTKVTNGNQGKPNWPRFEQIEHEFNCVPHDGTKGEWKLFQKENLATIPELIEYMLRGRDAL